MLAVKTNFGINALSKGSSNNVNIKVSPNLRTLSKTSALSM